MKSSMLNVILYSSDTDIDSQQQNISAMYSKIKEWQQQNMSKISNKSFSVRKRLNIVTWWEQFYPVHWKS